MSGGVDVILTRYRRPYLRRQLQAIGAQKLRPSSVTVFQNGMHRRFLRGLAHAYGAEFAWSSRNTKHFGRFAYAMTGTAEIVAVLDDDIIPGPRCLEAYVSQCLELDAIIGGNGRFASLNPARERLEQPAEFGPRQSATEVDFVGHLWVVRREWLHAMFSIPPHTWDTGEDMHLCFSAKLVLGIRSFAGAQLSQEEFADTTHNALAGDRHASFRSSSHAQRPEIERYFADLGLKFVSPC